MTAENSGVSCMCAKLDPYVDLALNASVAALKGIDHVLSESIDEFNDSS